MRLRLFVGFALLLLLAVFSQAQLPTPTSDDQMGISPYQSYHGGDIDNINLSTGILVIHFPLLSYPQRGGLLKEGISLLYNGKAVQIQHVGCPDDCAYQWLPTAHPPGVTIVDDNSVGIAVQPVQVGQNPDGSKVFKNIYSVQEADGSKHTLGQIGNVSNTWNRGEVFAGGRHLATYSGGTSETTYFIHGDYLGTERMRSNLAGQVYETCTSLPYGDALTCTGSDPSPLHFTGKMRDAETGLDDFPARYYSYISELRGMAI